MFESLRWNIFLSRRGKAAPFSFCCPSATLAAPLAGSGVTDSCVFSCESPFLVRAVVDPLSRLPMFVTVCPFIVGAVVDPSSRLPMPITPLPHPSAGYISRSLQTLSLPSPSNITGIVLVSA